MWKVFALGRRSLLHPFFFTAFPVLFLFSHNIGHVRFSEVLPFLFISLGTAILLFLGLRAVVKEGRKAAILVSILSIFFFSSGHILNVFRFLSPGAALYLYLVVLVLFLAIRLC